MKPWDAAYPYAELNYDGSVYYQHPGLTKREYFAAMAMQGLLSNLTEIEGFREHEIEEFAVMRADALIAELNKENKT
jgi:hypothetical protein